MYGAAALSCGSCSATTKMRPCCRASSDADGSTSTCFTELASPPFLSIHASSAEVRGRADRLAADDPAVEILARRGSVRLRSTTTSSVASLESKITRAHDDQESGIPRMRALASEITFETPTCWSPPTTAAHRRAAPQGRDLQRRPRPCGKTRRPARRNPARSPRHSAERDLHRRRAFARSARPRVAAQRSRARRARHRASRRQQLGEARPQVAAHEHFFLRVARQRPRRRRTPGFL